MTGREFKRPEVCGVEVQSHRIWRGEDGAAYTVVDSVFVDNRPVVLIDPADRQQVQRLLVTLCRQAGIALPTISGTDAMQDALRSLIEPPKPPEPTGLGAVIITADDEMYVRDKTTTTVAHWKRAAGQENGKRHRYDDLRVVAVLNDGVEPLADWERELLRGDL